VLVLARRDVLHGLSEILTMTQGYLFWSKPQDWNQVRLCKVTILPVEHIGVNGVDGNV
jgi:hypothetical protein